MKTVILAGGYGTRLSEETGIRPKPLVEIGGMPILWHIMKIYSVYGYNDFIICLGYKGFMIKEFFVNYYLKVSDINVDLREQKVEMFNNNSEPWNITLVDTGEDTMTGGRIKRIRSLIDDDETFFMTYGDGLSDINFNKLLEFHKQQGSYATLTAVQPPGRFGAFNLESDQKKITHFREKPIGGIDRSAWINGGFFVLEPKIFDFIQDDTTVWEKEPLTKLAHNNHLSAYKHDGFWQNMDSLRDKMILEEMWQEGNPPWMNW